MFKVFSVMFKKIANIEKQYPEQVARIYIVLGAFICVLSYSFVKSSTLTVSQTLFFRGLLIISFNFISTNEPLYIEVPQKRTTLLIQSLMRAVQAILFYAALKLLSISETNILYLTYTIWAQIGAKFMLNEPLHYSAIRNSFFSIVGVVLITQPSQIFGKSIDAESNDSFWGFIFALGAGLLFAISSVMIKTLGQSVSSSTILQYYHIWCLIIGSLMMVVTQETSADMYSYANFKCIFFVFAFSFIYQTLEIRGFLLVSVAKLAPYTFTNVLFSLLSDMVFYSTVPDLTQLLGITIIVLPLVFNR